MSDQPGFDQEIRLHVYRRFVETGRPPSVPETARAMDAPIEDVEAAFRRLHDGHVLVLHPGTTDIWMANPLSAVRTSFTVEIECRSYFGNCVWDALGVVAMLDGTGRVLTTCPDCDEPLALEVSDRALTALEGIVHYEVPARRWWDDIGYT